MKISFVRNFTVEAIQPWLDREMRAAGLAVECHFGGFAEAAEEIHRLGPGDADITVLALGLEMTAADFGRSSWAAEAACERHLMLVRSAIEREPGTMVVNTVLPPLFPATGLAAEPGVESHAALVDRLNVELRALAASDPARIALVDWTAFARELGEQGTYDHRYWHNSGAPFATPFLKRYAAAIASIARVRAGKVRKCLVLDCDNTLWGGIVGEAGVDGILLAADTVPGAYYQQFQRAIIDLQRRGVAIALCSRNNEQDVFDVLDSHPDCLLRREYLAAWRIDWNDKPVSISDIAQELNIGLDALVFVDDSPNECELVRAALPDVRVLQVPESPVALVGFLERQYLFDAMVVTDADRQRTRSFHETRARRNLAAGAADLGDYKQRLQTRLQVRAAHDADRARVVQLLQRTNQFNLTTRRHGDAELSDFLRRPDVLVAVAELDDRFGDLGLIGCAIAVNDGASVRIDTLLMSCRALGRDAELAFAAALYRMVVTRWGRLPLRADFLPTTKNAVVADFWARAGLLPTGPGEGGEGIRYASPPDLLATAASVVPTYVTLVELDGREVEVVAGRDSDGPRGQH